MVSAASSTNLRNLLQPDTFDFFALEPHGTRIATADVEVVTDYANRLDGDFQWGVPGKFA